MIAIVILSILAELPMWFAAALVACYLAVGGLMWSRLMYKWELEFGLADDLVRAERVGTFTLGETAAFLAIKIAFIFFWSPFMLFKLLCRMVGLFHAPSPSF